MLTKIKTLIITLGTVFMLSSPAIVLAAVPTIDKPNANPQKALCSGTNSLTIVADPGATGDCTAGGTDSTDKVNALIKKVINIFSVIVGVVAVIMIIIGGFRYITSAGAAEKIKSARNSIMYALIGLVIVALAQVVVKYVLTQAV